MRRQLDELDRRVEDRSSSLERRFDAIVSLLERRRFLRGWSLTERGEVLARIFHESDLLVATVVCEGSSTGSTWPRSPAWRRCSPTSTARRTSRPHRGSRAAAGPGEPHRGGRPAPRGDQERVGLPAARLPDPTFLALAHAWAAGESFRTVLSDEDLSGATSCGTSSS
ncbi:MAG: hypothetical protein R2711_03950 [Acidimicrobiales bacterium]